jgi:hypothetical protein
MQRSSTSIWFNSAASKIYGVRWCHDGAFVGFYFAKIAWQFALHTRDGIRFREEIL